MNISPVAKGKEPEPRLLQHGTYKTVTCRTCTKEVRVELIPYGCGHVAVCPECKKLAYNGD